MAAQKAIALQLRKLASDPASQQFICQEPTCMQGLLTLLHTSPAAEPDTLTVALQALAFLASHPSNRDTLTSQPGLIVRLVALRDHANPAITAIVAAVLDHLQSAVNKDSQPAATGQGRRASVAGGRGGRRSLHTLNLQVLRAGGAGGEATSLAMDERARLEKQLIVVKGVISVSVNKAGGVAVYSKKDDAEMMDSLHAAVKAVDAAFSIVIQSSSTTTAHNKENLTPPPSTTTATASPAPATLPALSLKLATSTTQPSSSTLPAQSIAAAYATSRALVAHSTFEHNSLHSRFQAKQRKAVDVDVKQGVVKGLFSSVSSFFW